MLACALTARMPFGVYPNLPRAEYREPSGGDAWTGSQCMAAAMQRQAIANQAQPEPSRGVWRHGRAADCRLPAAYGLLTQHLASATLTHPTDR
jgi:hypothetical protein